MDTDHLLRQAIRAHRLGDGRAAENLLREAITRDPRSAKPHLALGQLLLADRREAEALNAFQYATRQVPGAATAHFILGATLFNLKRVAEALLPLCRAVLLDPSKSHFMASLRLSRQKVRPDSANLAELSRLVVLDPLMVTALSEMQSAAVAAQDWSRVVAMGRRLVPLAPSSAKEMTYYAFAQHKIDLGLDIDKVASWIAVLEPEDPWTEHTLATLMFNRERFAQAERFCRSALARGWNNSETWFLLARAVRVQGRKDEAESAAAHAVALDPNFFYSKQVLDLSATAEDFHPI